MTEETKILIVDDDVEICDLLQDFLQRHGYKVAVAHNGAEMFAVLEDFTAEIIILDVMLPGEDGLQLCRRVREQSQVPIIMLSALGDDVDRIVGLEVGADDYLPKPFNPRELLARIKALLRRASNKVQEERQLAVTEVHFADLTLDCNRRSLKTVDGLTVPLSAGEFDLLFVFIHHPGQTLNREQLLDLTREREYEPFDRSIDVQIGRLRKKVEKDPKQPKIIATVRGGGYRFTAKVKITKS